MKNLFTLAIAFFVATVSFAQTTRPEKVDDENIDKFVTSAFDLYDKKQELSSEIGKLDIKVTAFEKGETKIGDSTLIRFESRLKKAEADYENQKTELEKIANQGGDVLGKATDIKPATKIPKATKNVKAAISIVNQAREGSIPDAKLLSSVRSRFDKYKATKPAITK